MANKKNSGGCNIASVCKKTGKLKAVLNGNLLWDAPEGRTHYILSHLMESRVKVGEIFNVELNKSLL